MAPNTDQTDLVGSPPPLADPSVHLSSNRTSLSMERTRMSTDRTLMSVVRTSLSMISFGFTIFQVFHQLADKYLNGGVTHASARNFGLALVVLGVGLLVSGLFAHASVMKSLRLRRDDLEGQGLLRRGRQYQTSATAVVAVLLLLTGLLAVLGMIARTGPFG